MPESSGSTPVSEIKGLLKQVKLRPLHLALGAALSLLFLWLAFRQVSLAQLGKILAGLNWSLVVLSLMLSTLGTLLRAARWRLLYYPNQGQVRFIRLTGLLFFSQMLNLLIPARAGEVARIALLESVKPARTLGVIAVEKLLDLLTLLAFTLALPLAVVPPDWFQEPRQSFLVLALGLFAAFLLLFFFKKPLIKGISALLGLLPQKWGDRLRSLLKQALASLDLFQSPWVSLSLQAWSFLIWGMGALVDFILLHAFSLDLPFSAAVFTLLVLQIGIAVPSIPGRLGVFQYLVILALSAFGVPKEIALSYSIALYLVGFGPHIVFGTIYGLREGVNKFKAKSL